MQNNPPQKKNYYIKKTVRKYPNTSWEYKNYSDFKALLTDQNRLKAEIRNQMSTLPPQTNSLTYFLSGGKGHFKLDNLLLPAELKTSLDEVVAAVRSADITPDKGGKLAEAKKEATQAVNTVADLRQYLHTLLRQNKGFLDQTAVSRVKGLLSKEMKGRSSLKNLPKNFSTSLAQVFGHVFEGMVSKYLGELTTEDGSSLGIKAMIFDQAGADFKEKVRVEKQSSKNPMRVTTPLIDALGEAGEGPDRFKFALSIKFSEVALREKAYGGIAVLSNTTIGKLFHVLEDENKLPPLWAMRRLAGYTQELSQEARNYLIVKNLREVIAGRGLDSITDIIINDEIFSAEHIFKMIESKITPTLLMMSAKFAAQSGATLPGNKRARDIYRDDKLLTPEDKAVRTWIDQKFVDAIDGTNVTVTIPFNLLK